MLVAISELNTAVSTLLKLKNRCFQYPHSNPSALKLTT